MSMNEKKLRDILCESGLFRKAKKDEADVINIYEAEKYSDSDDEDHEMPLL